MSSHAGGSNQPRPNDADVADALASLRKDVKRLADDLTRLAQSQQSMASATIAGALEDGKNQVLRLAGQVEGYASEVEDDMRTRIRNKPLTAVMVAVFVGYALRSSRRRR
jgi:ElaB/YqjD/DUF883 family membrane-anchored ribosome-binding protein